MNTPKLGRKKAPRERLMRNLATSLVLYEKVQTTEAKAKAVRPFVERLITHARKDTLASRRYAKSLLFDSNAVRKLFEDLTHRQGTRTSGFVRLTKIGNRAGDSAPMAQLELLYTPVEEVIAAQTKTKVKVSKKASTKEEPAATEEETTSTES